MSSANSRLRGDGQAPRPFFPQQPHCIFHPPHGACVSSRIVKIGVRESRDGVCRGDSRGHEMAGVNRYAEYVMDDVALRWTFRWL